MSRQPSDDQKAELLAELRKYAEIEAKIFTLLAEDKFEELEQLGDGGGLTAKEIAEAFNPKKWPKTKPGPIRMSATRSISRSTFDCPCTVEVRRRPFGGSHSSPTLCYTVFEKRDSKRVVNIKSIGGADGAGSA